MSGPGTDARQDASTRTAVDNCASRATGALQEKRLRLPGPECRRRPPLLPVYPGTPRQSGGRTLAPAGQRPETPAPAPGSANARRASAAAAPWSYSTAWLFYRCCPSPRARRRVRTRPNQPPWNAQWLARSRALPCPVPPQPLSAATTLSGLSRQSANYALRIASACPFLRFHRAASAYV